MKNNKSISEMKKVLSEYEKYDQIMLLCDDYTSRRIDHFLYKKNYVAFQSLSQEDGALLFKDTINLLIYGLVMQIEYFLKKENYYSIAQKIYHDLLFKLSIPA